MSSTDKILQSAQQLYDSGCGLLTKPENVSDFAARQLEYQKWFTQALNVINTLTPERAIDFSEAYKLKTRKVISPDTYTIDDYLKSIALTRGGTEKINTEHLYRSLILKQLGILAGAIDSAPSILSNIRLILQLEVLDSDISTAKELLKSGHLRSAGVICGVALEAHLKEIIDRHQIATQKKSLTISDANDLLKTNNLYDVSIWRLIQRLADIRNLCAHSKDREPKKDEIEDLILGTDKVLKEIL